MQLVGRDLEPGRYTATGFEFCYWERLSGLSGELDEVIVNDIPNSRAIVEILRDTKTDLPSVFRSARY